MNQFISNSTELKLTVRIKKLYLFLNNENDLEDCIIAGTMKTGKRTKIYKSKLPKIYLKI